MKKKILVSVLLILTCTFTACGKKDRKDIEKDLEGNTTENTETSEKISNEEIPEHLSYMVAGTTVDAKVSAEGYGQVPVYKLGKREGSDEWIRSYAELLFDGGEYVNVKPYEFCSKTELETERQFWEECLSELTENKDYYYIEQEIEELEYYIEKSKEGNADAYPEDMLIYETDSSNKDVSEIVKSNRENALIKGEVNGGIWKLEYSQGRYDCDEAGTYSYVYAPILYGTYMERGVQNTVTNGVEGDFGENICDMRTAKKEAQKLLDRLDFNDMELIYSSDMYSYKADENGYGDFYCYGYFMVYAPMLKDIKSPVNMTAIEASGDGTNYITQPRVFILTNSDGIFSFCIAGGYEIEETLTEHCSMLTFEQIDSIARDEFKKAGLTQCITIKDVNFGYMYVSYEDNSYAAVPVWSYCIEDSCNGETVIKPILTICALDGTIIETEECSFDYKY